jgi:tetratricopeptide (TPR) repeat protein
VEELYNLEMGDSKTTALEAWATAENLGIPGFDLDRVATFYPKIYERRFGDDPDSGYAYLEDVMKDAEPNIGYSVLAQVLEKTRHKVVITTNFDNLVADALAIYTSTFPLVCGHESLTGFVKPRLRRPLVAKIHRDLLLAPKSDVKGISKLDERWDRVLRRLLKEYTLVVLGYGGNDGGLMGFLETLSLGDMGGGIYWCYRLEDGQPDERIGSLVAKHRGKRIPIVGFDEFMLQLGERLRYTLLDEVIESKARERVKRYREQFKGFQKNLARAAEVPDKAQEVKQVREAVATTVGREKSWWAWGLKAEAEKDPDKRQQIYAQGVKQFPESPELIGDFALFMHEVRKDYDEAVKLYRQALELDPENATNTGNFAAFMEELREDYDEAEKLYRRALELDPEDASNTANFAAFMEEARKDYSEAERLYRRALELDPEDAENTGNFAMFMHEIRNDYDEAEKLFRRALELDPNNAENTGSFAEFLITSDRFDEAGRMLLRAWDLNNARLTTVAAAIAFLWSLRAQLEKSDDTPGLARLKFLFEKGFEWESWSFDVVLSAASSRLGRGEIAFYRLLADAIQDHAKVGELDRFERWKEIKPIPVDEPWNMET